MSHCSLSSSFAGRWLSLSFGGSEFHDVKIVFHAVYYLPEFGGMESHIQSLAWELRDRGHDVHVVCGKSLPGLATYEVLDGIHIHRTAWFGRNPVGWFLYTGWSVFKLLNVARGADIVHGESFPSGWPVTIAKRVYGTPVLITLHETRFQKFVKKALLRPGLRLLYLGIDHIFANSLPQAEAARRVAEPRKVEPYVNACDTKVFHRAAPAFSLPGKKILVCSARLIPKKGVRHAIEAMPAILARYPSHIYIVGQGVLRPELERLVQQLNVQDSVTFLGKRPNTEMPPFLSSGDVALVPSFYEETSIAALEAMACETPVAASRVGGLPQIVEDEVSGALFEAGNAADIAEKVIWLLGQDREQMGKAARRRVMEKWDVRLLADRHLAVYEELLSRKKKTH
jgi:glycosyltransferase involved in cell wall biosynthesis